MKSNSLACLAKKLLTNLSGTLVAAFEHLSPFEIELRDSEFGTFKVELDSNQVKDFGEKAEEFLQSAEVERADLQKKFFETVGLTRWRTGSLGNRRAANTI